MPKTRIQKSKRTYKRAGTSTETSEGYPGTTRAASEEDKISEDIDEAVRAAEFERLEAVRRLGVITCKKDIGDQAFAENITREDLFEALEA